MKTKLFFTFTIVVTAFFLSLAGNSYSATIDVDTTDDENNSDGDCSLREAVISANTDAAVDACTAGSGADEITLPAGTYTLSEAGTGEDSAATGDLDITDDLTLTGAGEVSTIVDADGIDRVFQIISAAVMMTGLQITGGHVVDGHGGGILNEAGGGLAINQSVITGNSVEYSRAGFPAGGGIANTSSTLTLSGVTVSDNTLGDDCPVTDGGGIYLNKSSAVISDSTISGNQITSTPGSALGNGGGIYVGTDSTLTMTNSTISGNTIDTGGTSYGGGLYLSDGTADLFNVTIANNSVDGTASELGGGLYTRHSTSPTLTIQNTLIADNTGGTSPDCYGTITSLSYSIIEDTTGCTVSSGTATTGDPSLGSLANNGGPTETHSLKDTSIAIDTGDTSGCVDASGATLTTDQRGKSRPLDGNKDGTAVCDIGAFEKPKISLPTKTITPPSSIKTTP